MDKTEDCLNNDNISEEERCKRFCEEHKEKTKEMLNYIKEYLHEKYPDKVIAWWEIYQEAEDYLSGYGKVKVFDREFKLNYFKDHWANKIIS